MSETPSKNERLETYKKIKEEAEQWQAMDGSEINFDHPNFIRGEGARELVVEIRRILTDNFTKDEEAIQLMRDLRKELWWACNGGI